MNNLRFVCYTNQQYIPIANLFSDQFNLKTNYQYYLTIITNDNSNEIKVNNRIIPVNTKTEFGGAGEHFSYSLLKALKKFPEKYIFFFCDDYFLTKSINYEKLSNLLDLLEKDDIKFFSFSSCHPQAKGWEPYEQIILPDTLYNIPDNFQYMFSVQPCIWNRETLISVLEENIGITLHQFDNSVLNDSLKNKRTLIPGTEIYTPWQNKHIYNFKKLCSNYKAYDELDDKTDNNFFIIQYVEAIRHGLFNIYLNVRGAQYIKNILSNLNITPDDLTYGRFFAK